MSGAPSGRRSGGDRLWSWRPPMKLDDRLRRGRRPGRARVYVSNAQGREVQLNVIGPGEYFGEVTLDGGPRSASVMSLDDCRCAVVKRSELLTLIEKEPAFALHMMRKLASRVRD